MNGLWLRLYARLLALYPRELRDGRSEMLDIFADSLADPASTSSGRWARLRLVVRTLFDLGACHVLAYRRPLGVAANTATVSASVNAAGGPGLRVVAEFWHDLRLSWRGLVRAPGFTLVALVVLTLGIGANTTIFTLVDRLFFQAPPHVEEPGELVRIVRTSERTETGSLSYPDLDFYRQQTRSMSGLLGYDPDGFAATVGVGDALRTVRGWFVTDNYFDVLGTVPGEGRFFLAEENERPGTHPVVVASHGFWQSILGGRSEAIGETITLNGHVFTLIGVAPRGFVGVSPIETTPDVWVPIMMQPLLAPVGDNWAIERVPGISWVWLSAIGRLRDDSTFEQASSEISDLGRRLEREYPEWSEGQGAALSGSWRLHPSEEGGLLTMSRLLGVVVALLLLIACANVAILVLARTTTRQREIGMRLALGASRGRVVRQQVTENLGLALVGGALGFLVAWFGSSLAASLLPIEFDGAVRPRFLTLAFSLVLAAAVAVTAGVWPALASTRVDVSRALRAGDSLSGRSVVRSGLVVAQVALSILLVVGAMLFGRSLQSARAVELGFEIDRRALVEVNLGNHGYDAVSGVRYVEQSLEQLRAVPGVTAASTMKKVPFRGAAFTSVVPEGYEVEGDEAGPGSGYNVVSPGYFEAMGLDVREGRAFVEADGAEAPLVLMVNEEFARRFWPGESAIGKTIEWRDDQAPAPVVGVVEDAEYYQLGEEQQTQVFVSLAQNYDPRLHFVVASRLAPEALERQIEQALLRAGPDVAISSFESLEGVFADEIARYRTAAVLVSLFGGLALVLAMVGLYGVLSYLVLQRRREIGVRMALGASARRVAREVLANGLRLVTIGAALGLLGAAAVTRFVASFLYRVEGTDLASWLLALVTMLAVALLATLVPAHRASRVDPVEAMRID